MPFRCCYLCVFSLIMKWTFLFEYFVCNKFCWIACWKHTRQGGKKQIKPNREIENCSFPSVLCLFALFARTFFMTFFSPPFLRLLVSREPSILASGRQRLASDTQRIVKTASPPATPRFAVQQCQLHFGRCFRRLRRLHHVPEPAEEWVSFMMRENCIKKRKLKTNFAATTNNFSCSGVCNWPFACIVLLHCFKFISVLCCFLLWAEIIKILFSLRVFASSRHSANSMEWANKFPGRN